MRAEAPKERLILIAYRSSEISCTYTRTYLFSNFCYVSRLSTPVEDREQLPRRNDTSIVFGIPLIFGTSIN